MCTVDAFIVVFKKGRLCMHVMQGHLPTQCFGVDPPSPCARPPCARTRGGKEEGEGGEGGGGTLLSAEQFRLA